MRMARIARFLEFVGDRMPGVHELTLLVPAFFGLCSAARALGLDMDLGPETVVVSVTFSCSVWIILNSPIYHGPGRLEEARNKFPRPSHSSDADSWPRTPERNTGTQPEQQALPVNVKRWHGESAQQEKRHSPRLQ